MSLVPETCELDRKALGRLIRAIRDEEFVSIRDLAKSAVVDFSHVSKIELGRSEVSVGRFLRICYALQVPPGLVLEACGIVSYGIYEATFYNDDAVKERATTGGHIDSEKRKLIRDFLTGSALALSYILKSSNPLLMLAALDFPVPSQRENFKNFVVQQLPHLGAAKRRALLRHIIVGGWKSLEQFGLVSDHLLNLYLDDAINRKERWMPAPRNPFFQVEGIAPSPMEAQVALLIASGKQKGKSIAAGNSQKSHLTQTATYETIAGVNNLWPALKRQLQSATAKTGKKSELAKFLHVDLTRVSQWLTDKKSAREPGAEYTLQMQAWVRKQ